MAKLYLYFSVLSNFLVRISGTRAMVRGHGTWLPSHGHVLPAGVMLPAPPRGHLAMSRATFGCHTDRWWGVTTSWWGEVGILRPPRRHRTAPGQTHNVWPPCLAHNVTMRSFRTPAPRQGTSRVGGGGTKEGLGKVSSSLAGLGLVPLTSTVSEFSGTLLLSG